MPERTDEITSYAPSPAGYAPNDPPPSASSDSATRAGGFSSWLQYLYFLRTPLLGWCALPTFCLIDALTGLSALTRGIVTMTEGWQIFHTVFFSISLLMAVLVCGKNVVINGEARFGTAPPPPLLRLMRSSRPRTMWWVLALAQAPAMFAIVYVTCRTIVEQTAWAKGRPDADALLRTVWPYSGWHLNLYLWLVLGLLAAGTFWYLVSIFYYWTYPAPVPPEAGGTGSASQTAARPPVPLIFPVPAQTKLTGINPDGSPQPARKNISFVETATRSQKPLLAQWIESVAGRFLALSSVGYAAGIGQPLYELHFLSVVSLCAIVLLYLFLYPLVAPVLVSKGFGADPVLALVIFVAFAYGALTYKDRKMQLVGGIFTSLLLVGLGIFYWFYFTDGAKGRVLMATSFPTFGAILVILLFFQWLVSGATFLLDRHRIPVLTMVLAVIFVPKLLFPKIDGEHYFEAREVNGLVESNIDTPAQALTHRAVPGGSAEPLVIVSAMGGGIQAAEWTAQVMARLESDLRNQQHYSLHDHLLMASGVSGGSVGLLPYMLEYTNSTPEQFSTVTAADGRDLLTARLTSAPGCSGLEAVAWGLEYYDLQRLLLTIRLPWLQNTSLGADPDRTWALTEALNRNLKDKECGTDAFGQLPTVESGSAVTLMQAAAALHRGTMPAFTFNTTVAETGDRFLLSNYYIPANKTSAAMTGDHLKLGSGFLPAESFLQAYTFADCCKTQSGGNGRYADVSLVTAARMSATFPVVSSATRIPKAFAPVASHFVDGGYYDNDGTASVIEFLASAMKERGPVQRPINILLVEIRDSPDLDPDANDDDLAHQTGHADGGRDSDPPKPWSTFGQVGAPLLGMWNAGHKSTTRRNRRELCLLEQAYQSQGLQVHHVVFGIPNQVDRPAANGHRATYKASPLSWKLTEGQKDYIRTWVDGPVTQESLNDVSNWLRNPVPTTTDSDACLLRDQRFP